MLDAAELGPLLLELSDPPATGDHAAIENFGDCGDLLGAKVGPVAALWEKKIDLDGLRVGIILSGGNVDLDRLPWTA